MNSILAINFKNLLLFFLFSISALHAQEEKDFDDYSEEDQQRIKASTTKKAAIFSISVFRPFTTDKSAIGAATKGRTGGEIGAQLFLYDRFFVGAFYQIFSLNVTDNSLVGLYSRSTVSSIYLEFGYEFELNKNFNLGLSIAPLGAVSYNNYIEDGRIKQQKDSARLTMFKTYISYDIDDNFSVFIDYSFRSDRTNINTAAEIQNDFDRIQYHNIGLGLKLEVGLSPLFEKPDYKKNQ